MTASPRVHLFVKCHKIKNSPRQTQKQGWYSFGIVRSLKLEACDLLHKKSKGAEIVEFFIISLDFSYPPITLNLKLKFVHHVTP